MYIENVREFLLRLNFIEDKTNWEPGEIGGEYYKKINDNLQLFAVSTDKNDIMFISEHEVINPDPKKFFEDDYNNYKILSEYVIDIRNLADVLYNHNVIEYAERELFYLYVKLQENYKILKKQNTDENLIAEYDEFIGFAETSISLLKDENWLTFDGLQEFIENVETFLKQGAK
jgi:hypothetical protein